MAAIGEQSLRWFLAERAVAEPDLAALVRDYGHGHASRRTTLEGTSYLTAGNPVMLGSLDAPTSTRQLDIEVVMEEVR
jgi:hypothetical protein